MAGFSVVQASIGGFRFELLQKAQSLELAQHDGLLWTSMSESLIVRSTSCVWSFIVSSSARSCSRDAIFENKKPHPIVLV